MRKVNHWFERYKLEYEHLAIFRMVFALFFLLFSGFPRFDWMSDYPDFFYRPNLSIATFFDTFPPDWFFHIINVTLPLLAVFIFVGFKTFWSSLLFGVLLIIAYSFTFAFGKINHSHFIPYTAIIFAFSGWGKCFSLDQHFKSLNLTFNVIPFYALIVSFSYFTSGFAKLINGWLNWENQASYGYLIQNYFLTEEKTFIASQILTINSLLFWKFVDYSVVFIETMPLLFLLLFRKRLFRFSLLLVALFHLLVYLTFNISFAYYPLFLCLFIIDWTKSPTIKKTIEYLNTFSTLLQNKLKMTIIISILFFSYVFILYSGLADYDGDFPFTHTVSLFLSFAIVLYFYVENKTNRNG